MFRVLLYVVLIFALGAGFAWLADNPGEVTLSFAEFDVKTTVMAAAILLLVLLVLLRIVWLILRGLVRAPRRLSRQVADRRRELGHNALTEGFIAIGSGDASLASHFAAEARYYVAAEPMTLLLAAQTAQLTGDEMGTRAAYEAMLAKPQTRILGLRGLFLEARRRNDNDAARSFAAAAQQERPGLAWAGSALLEYQATAGEWAEALGTVAELHAAGAIDGDRMKRLQAVLKTARAQDLEGSSPDLARDLAVEAHRQAPDLVPAAVIAARLLTRHGDAKKAARTVETSWRIEPHPELAAAYLDVRPGESGRDRMKRIAQLAKIRANHVEGRIAMARAAIDAKDWAAAREEVRSVIASNPTERAYLMMAEIEEGEHGDIGRARHWLSLAVRAPRDRAWVADGYVFDEWHPVSPASGRVDVFEWKVPADRLGQPLVMPHEDPPDPPKAATGTALVKTVTDIDAETGDRVAPEAELKHQPDDPGPAETAKADPTEKSGGGANGKGRRFRLFSSD